jgi:protein-tyrosine-phosphatase/DNA-binding transcriptional ArsR family regulator
MESAEAATIFAALSQETRLDLMRLLMSESPNGLPASDIASRLGIPASTLSFHLAALERAGLTHSTRHGRQIVHAARITGVRQVLGFLTETCYGGRPELCGDLARLLPSLPEENHGMTPAFNVLFLCTHNAARSIMAEAILNKCGGDRFHAYSAGSDPIAAPHLDVLEKLRASGHDTTSLRSKSWEEFTGPDAPRMDFVITLCDTLVGRTCPEFGKLVVTGAWPLPDPAKFTGSTAERATLLKEVYASLRRRIEIFISLPFASLNRMVMKARLDDIGGDRFALRGGGNHASRH